MRTMQDIISDIRYVSNKFTESKGKDKALIKEFVKLRRELQDRVDLMSIERSSS
jgi:fructose-1,6-bisphosphatase